MTFIFRNMTIFWDISKWNRGQKKMGRGSNILVVRWGGGGTGLMGKQISFQNYQLKILINSFIS